MTIHRTQIGKAHIFKEAARKQRLFDRCFDFVCHIINVSAQRQHAHDLAIALFELQILGLEALACQVVCHTAHAFGD